MFEYSVYMVVSFEVCVFIFWCDVVKVFDVVVVLWIIGRDLLEFGVVDEVFEEFFGGNNWVLLDVGENFWVVIECYFD